MTADKKWLRLSKPDTCPVCERPLPRHGHGARYACAFCDTEISVARSYEWATALLTLVAFVPFIGAAYSLGATGRWIPVAFLFLLVLRILSFTTIRPWYQAGKQSTNLLLFWFCWILWAVVLSVYYLLFGGIALNVGGLDAMNEHMSNLSLPLGLLSHRFVITPETPFLDVAGITFGDSLFFSALLTGCFFFVRAVFRRNRVTAMNLSGSSFSEDE